MQELLSGGELSVLEKGKQVMGIPEIKDLGALMGMPPLRGRGGGICGPTGSNGPTGLNGPTTGASMDAGRVSPWKQTPAWMFWRPAWRMIEFDDPHRTSPYWRYQTNRQRAKEVLREKFDAEYIEVEVVRGFGRKPKL